MQTNNETEKNNPSQADFEARLAKVRASGKWYAVSMFCTNYGPWGFKIEVDAMRLLPNGSYETCGYNIDGPNLSATVDRRKAYTIAKDRFWAQWKKDHPGEFLEILTFKKAWGL